ncbi:MAG: alginate lyase family protein [Mariniphaga sp.]|nr:alginate lyase family protein [Mariniphaga sp.]
MGRYSLIIDIVISKYRKLYYLLLIIPRLGMWNVAYMAWYRFTLKTGLRQYLFPAKVVKSGPDIFHKRDQVPKTFSQEQKIIETADRIFKGELCYYGDKWLTIGNPPQWFLNPFNGKQIIEKERHWTRLPDFSDVGDIKNIWEASRFSWVPVLALAFNITGEDKYINCLNRWLDNWIVSNPVNIGPNWKCGQEASIRIFNILIALHILEQAQTPTEVMLDFIDQHIKRINKNILYSIAQDNNHGISEAAGLYLGGAFLNRVNPNRYPEASKFSAKGKKWLENRINKLILCDGSFSQHSIVYHRLVLDILSVVELFQKKWVLEEFPDRYYHKISFAIKWFSAFIDSESGNAPNLGANDGTVLFDFGQVKYRDFRPTLALASAVFEHPLGKEFSASHPLLELFRIDSTVFNDNKVSASRLFEDGGYCKLVGKCSTVFIRLPIYKFRPTNSDGLHIDLWSNGVNWIRDAGSYSYAVSQEKHRRFSGTAGHSTVQFDDIDQMPLISRFLYGKWLRSDFIEVDFKKNYVSSGYTDYQGNSHNRSVSECHNGWTVKDNINGNFKSATQRFLLAPDSWTLENNTVFNSHISFSFKSKIIDTIYLNDGCESLFYMEKNPIPVLEVSLTGPGCIETAIEFNQ